MRKLSSIMSLILVACLTLGGVSASWIYATGAVEEILETLTVSMPEWDFSYTVSFLNNGKNLIAPITVTDNSEEFVIMNKDTTGTGNVTNETAKQAAEKAESDMGTEEYKFSHWINAGSTRVDSIPAGNTDDITLYPSFVGVYTAMFVDQDGNILAWDTFTENNYSNVTAKASSAQTELEKNLDSDLTFDYWEVRVTKNGTTTKTKLSDYEFKDEVDVTIYPVCTYNGDVNLIPVDEDGDGDTDSYQVGGYNNPNGQSLVEIPDYVNGIPITSIAADAFSSYDGVHSVVIPNTITTVGGNVLATDWSGIRDSGETVTIYFKGSYDEWIDLEEKFTDGWDDGLSASSRIFFLNGGETVDTSQGYLQASATISWGTITGISWSNSTITSDMASEYTGYCDCSISTTGDTGHIYVDASGNVMNHNDDGTPINASGTEIYFEDGGWFGTDKLTDGTNTYYRYRPDKVYWDGVTIS